MRSVMSLYGTGVTIPESDRIYWQLSALLARKYYPPLKLYADKPFADWLIKRCGIVFDEVDTETIARDTKGAHKMCWSAGKLAAMRDMAAKGEPFFHIDGDAFIFKPLPESFISSRMFCQCIEKAIPRNGNRYRRNSHYPLNELLPMLRMPRFMGNYYRLSRQPVMNMGIFGGSDTESIYEYADIAIKTFVENRHNNQCFKTFSRAMPHFLGIACISEQWALGAYCHWKNITPAHIMNRIDSFNVNRMHEVGQYLHIYTALRRFCPQYKKFIKHKLNQIRHEEFELAKAA
jgi:hypothetical protein